MTETSDIDKSIIKERYGSNNRLVSSMNQAETVDHIKSINQAMAHAELELKCLRAEYASSTGHLEELNEKARAAGFAEYVVPKSHDIVKIEKKSGVNGTPKVKVDPKDKAIIDMYKALKSTDAVIGLMGNFVPEAQIRAAISRYDSAK